MLFKALYLTHVDTWITTLLVFFISYLLFKMGKLKAQKITHMILRLLFVVMFVSGFGLVVAYKFQIMTIVKMIVAIWLIASMELILVKARKGKPTASVWVQFFISVVAVVVIGYRLI